MKKLLLAILTLFSVHAVAEVAVIVHPSNGDALDKSAINKIYLGKMKSFPNGNKIAAFDLAAGQPAKDSFMSGVVGKSASQYKAFWSKLVFTGKGKPPKEVGNDAAMVSAVAGDPNAIGYVSPGSVTADVKVIGTF